MILQPFWALWIWQFALVRPQSEGNEVRDLKKSVAAKMLNRAYIKFGKKNKIGTLLKEVYLRKDIFCGSELCTDCYNARTVKASFTDGHVATQRLSGPAKPSKKPVDYLIIDTNIVLHQMDLLNKPNLKNVVVLQTVLSEVKNQSPQLYSDLRELCADPEKRFYVFSNEFREYVACNWIVEILSFSFFVFCPSTTTPRTITFNHTNLKPLLTNSTRFTVQGDSH